MNYASIYGDAGGLADWKKIPQLEPRLPALLAYTAKHYAERDFVVFDEEKLTYGEVEQQSAILARQLLDAGAGKGMRIGILFPNNPRFVVAWMAVTRIGAVVVPISTLSQGAEILRIARHADLHMIISADRFLNHHYAQRMQEAFPGLAAQRGRIGIEAAPCLRAVWIWGSDVPAWAEAVDLARPPRTSAALLAAVENEVASSDLISIIYTSGSTADPKGVMHTHSAFMRQSAKLCATYPYQWDDRVYAPMPFFWVGGLTFTLLNIMYLGATVLGSARTATALLDFVEQQRTTYMVAWPHIVKALAADPTLLKRDLSCMRGGGLIEVLPPEKRPKNQPYFGYALGMSETSGPHTIAPPDLPDHLIGSMGPPMPGMEHRIVDVDSGKEAAPGATGELFIRGDALMVGLVKRERAEVFEPDGWYRTGDLCSFREGHLFFHGRLDDMIKSSGANVSPREVEAVLMGLPGVAQASVSAVPDEERAGIVGAIVVPKPGERVDPTMLKEQAAKQLSAYKVPRVIVIMEAAALPMMSSSKMDRRALVKILADEHKAAKKG